MSWSIWPLKENFYRSAAVVFFLALVVWAIASWFGPEWILPATFILIFMLAGFFFPTHYLMDSKSITVRGLISRKRRLWSSLAKYHLSKNGVHLVPEGRPSRMGGFRGIYLPYGHRREELLRFIEEKLGCGR